MRPDMIMMKGGSMVLLKNGEILEMEEDLIMSDGTRVMRDGTIILADGKSLTLVEGEGMITDASIAPKNGTDT